MTDQELLEAASEVAGIVGVYRRVHQPYGDQWVDGIDAGGLVFWNPLVDDGDALRLAVRTHMDVNLRTLKVKVVRRTLAKPVIHVELIKSESEDAVRRAIVRAAVEIGEVK